jgi:hypothetical protein
VIRLTTLISWATGVEEQEAILIFEKGYMRVPKDDHASLGKAFLEAPTTAFLAARVMDHSYPRATEVELQRLRQLYLGTIDVALNRTDRGVESELLE